MDCRCHSKYHPMGKSGGKGPVTVSLRERKEEEIRRGSEVLHSQTGSFKI